MIAWLAPGALIALAAAALPLAIHLLTRRNRRERAFPALRLLQAAEAGRARFARLRDRLALALRTLALAALALAIAGPSCSGDAAHGQAMSIIIDASASMRQRHGGGTSWDLAVAEARSRLGAHAGPAQVVIAGDEPRRSRPEPGAGRGAELALLASAGPGYGAGAAARELAAAALRLSQSGGGTLLLIADGSRSAWAGVDPAMIPPGVRFAAIDAGGGGANLAVRAISAEPGLAVAGAEVRIAAEVANYGAAEARVGVELLVDGARRTADLVIPPGGSAVLSERFRPAGPARRIAVEAGILASAGGDALADDDRRHGVLELVAALPVVVASDADATDTAGPLKPVLAALAAAGLEPRVVRGEALVDALAGAGAPPALCTVALAAPPPGLAMQAHLLDGGAWLQFLATPADVALAGGLPDLAAPLVAAPPSDLADRPRGLGVRLLRPEHPLLAGLAGRDGLTGQIEAWRYRPCALGDGAVGLIAFLDGSLALAERAAGRGRWLQCGLATADADSNLAALDCLPLLLAPLPRLLLPARTADLATACGGTLAAGAPLAAPDGARVPVVGGACRLDLPGVYRRDAMPAAAAAIPAGESDLRSVPPPSDAGAEGQAAAMASADAPLWSWLILAAILLGAGELLLVRPWRGRR